MFVKVKSSLPKIICLKFFISDSSEYFRCLPNHGLFVPSYHVELLKTIQPKKFSLCLREIESGSSTSSSLAEAEDQRSYFQFKASRRKENMKPLVRPVSGRYAIFVGKMTKKFKN